MTTTTTLTHKTPLGRSTRATWKRQVAKRTFWFVGILPQEVIQARLFCYFFLSLLVGGLLNFSGRLAVLLQQLRITRMVKHKQMTASKQNPENENSATFRLALKNFLMELWANHAGNISENRLAQSFHQKACQGERNSPSITRGAVNFDSFWRKVTRIFFIYIYRLSSMATTRNWNVLLSCYLSLWWSSFSSVITFPLRVNFAPLKGFKKTFRFLFSTTACSACILKQQCFFFIFLEITSFFLFFFAKSFCSYMSPFSWMSAGGFALLFPILVEPNNKTNVEDF